MNQKQKKLIVYGTGRSKTSQIMREFGMGVNFSGSNYIAEYREIQDFLSRSIPPSTDAIATLGILRGTGLALQTAAQLGIDRYYVDHSYFDPGYGGKCWLRISKNRHTMNYVPDTEISKDRWKAYFSETNPVYPWRTRQNRGNFILVLPPSHAVQWYFNANDWCDKIINRLKELLPEEQHKLIKIRIKPNEPIVDKAGNLIRMDTHANENQMPLEYDLANSNIVIAYNSNVALQATLLGIPVITNKHCSVYPVSFTLEDLKLGVDNEKFDTEPQRAKLFHWLSQCQFKRQEIRNGKFWNNILEHQEPVD